MSAAGSLLSQSCIHTTAALERQGWEMKNRVVYPPQLSDEPRRPAVSPEHDHIRLSNVFIIYTLSVKDELYSFQCKKYILKVTLSPSLRILTEGTTSCLQLPLLSRLHSKAKSSSWKKCLSFRLNKNKAGLACSLK